MAREIIAGNGIAGPVEQLEFLDADELEAEEPEQTRRRESWIPYPDITQHRYYTRDEFRESCNRDIDYLFEYVSKTMEEIEAALEQKNRQIAAQDRQITALIEERDNYKDTIADLCVQTRIRGTPWPEQPKRSAKLPDPDPLTDGESPRFEDWLSRMKNKLAGNEDHYPTEVMKITYVESRTGGKAAKHLASRMRDGAVNKFRTADEIFKHLEWIFMDPDRQINARRKFRNLQMKPIDPYHEFLAEFLYLAGEAAIHEFEYKEELYEKLTFKLKEMMALQLDDCATFEEFSTHCSQAANCLQSISESRIRARASERTETESDTENRKHGTTLVTTTRSTVSKNLLSEEKREMLRKGQCFYCKTRGHILYNCPVKKKTFYVKEIESRDNSRKEQLNSQP